MASLRSLLQNAAAAYQTEDFERAEALAAKACKADPKSVDAWDFYGMACQSLGDIVNAERAYKKALALTRAAQEREPENDKHALRQIFLLMRLGKAAEVEDLFALLSERHPESASLRKIITEWRMRPR